jgi:predicted nucleic acid-binding protein
MIALDTNILIYCCDKRDPERQQLALDLVAGTTLILPTAAVFERARALHLQQRWAFWDALLVSACLDCGVTRLA